MLEDVVTKIIAQILSLRVEVSRKHSSVKRPVVHGQGKVVQDEWNFVGFCSLLLKQSVGATLGALKILKDDYRHLGALRRTQHRGVLCNDHCGAQHQQGQAIEKRVLHMDYSMQTKCNYVTRISHAGTS